MSSRIFQSVIVQMKEATTRGLGVIDSGGNVIATSELSSMGVHVADPAAILPLPGEKSTVYGGKTFRPLAGSEQNLEYAVYVEGTDELAASYCCMLAVAIQSAKAYYEEKYDRSALVKSIITENILPGDIYVHAKERIFCIPFLPIPVSMIRNNP